MSPRYASARNRLTPGPARNYIALFASIRSGDRVVICCRVSHYTQNHNGNLKRQERFLRRELERLGAVVIGVVKFVGSGIDPFWIMPAVAIAEAFGPDVKLVAETTDRFVRHPAFHTETSGNSQARRPELEFLRYCASGYSLVTYLAPDATPKECRSFQRKRGQAGAGNRGGRPLKTRPGYKKRRRQKKLRQVLRLRRRGNSLSEIMLLTRIPKPTIRRWIRRFGT